MARKPDPIEPFFDHYAPFVKSLENFTYKAGMLLVAAETVLAVAEELEKDMPPRLVENLRNAIAGYKEATHGPR